jgi:hypothetical protein
VEQIFAAFERLLIQTETKLKKDLQLWVKFVQFIHSELASEQTESINELVLVAVEKVFTICCNAIYYGGTIDAHNAHDFETVLFKQE